MLGLWITFQREDLRQYTTARTQTHTRADVDRCVVDDFFRSLTMLLRDKRTNGSQESGLLRNCIFGYVLCYILCIEDTH